MQSHNTDFCRSIYVNARQEHKAPVVHIVKLAAHTYCGETADGEVLVSQVPNSCCKWAAKYEIMQAWVEKKKEEG